MKSRQVKKNLKKKIKRLQLDNDLMHELIENNPKMQELYDLYNNPLDITQTILRFQEYRIKRFIPSNMHNINKYAYSGYTEYATDSFRLICIT